VFDFIEVRGFSIGSAYFIPEIFKVKKINYLERR